MKKYDIREIGVWNYIKLLPGIVRNFLTTLFIRYFFIIAAAGVAAVLFLILHFTK